MIRNMVVAFAVIGLFGLGIARAEQRPETRRGDVKATQWLKQVAQDDVQEVLMAKIALTHATDNGVKDFARTLIHDHAQVAANIEALAQNRDVYIGGDVSFALKSVASAAAEQPVQAAANVTAPERVFEREAGVAKDKLDTAAKESSAAGAGMMGGKMGEIGKMMEKKGGEMGKEGAKMEDMMRSSTPTDDFSSIDVQAIGQKLDVSHQRSIDALQVASAGNDFDLVFLRTMVKAHEDAIQSFERAA